MDISKSHLLAVSLLISCSFAQAQDSELGETLVTVNDEAISKALYQGYYSIKQAESEGALSQTQRIDILNELVNYTLLAQDAKSQNLHQHPSVAANVQLEQRKVLANAAIKTYFDKNPISDAMLKARFAELYEGKENKEYKLRHILLSSKEEAEKALNQLADGSTFAALAEANSTDSSAATGGDLGWVSENQMLEGMKTAVSKLEKGSYTSEVVESDFGWHIVKMEDSRTVPAPSFSEMRGRLLDEMKRAQLDDYIRGLRKAANIEINQANQ